MPRRPDACRALRALLNSPWGAHAFQALQIGKGALGWTMASETVWTPGAWDDMMQRYGETLAAGEAQPVPEEEV